MPTYHLANVVDDYLIKNKFSKEIYNNCVKIDTNTPFFSSKIKDWAVYYMKKNNKIYRVAIFLEETLGLLVFLYYFAICKIKSFIFAIPRIP